MLDLNRDIDSLSNFKRNTPEYLRRLRESGHPLVLTINGKAALVVQDTASYQFLMEQAERARELDLLESAEDTDAGGEEKVSPDDARLVEMAELLIGKRGR